MQFTKEQLIKRLEEQESAARYALSFVQDSEILRDIEMDLRITEIALASLDAGSNSHPAHGPLSNDRLHRIREILGKAAAQSDGGNIGYAMADAVKAIDEVLERRQTSPEPVADVVAWSSPNEERTCDIRWRRHDVAPGPLYTATPAPVEPLTDEQIDNVLDSRGNILYVIADKRERLRMFAREILRAAMGVK